MIGSDIFVKQSPFAQVFSIFFNQHHHQGSPQPIFLYNFISNPFNSLPRKLKPGLLHTTRWSNSMLERPFAIFSIFVNNHSAVYVAYIFELCHLLLVQYVTPSCIVFVLFFSYRAEFPTSNKFMKKIFGILSKKNLLASNCCNKVQKENRKIQRLYNGHHISLLQKMSLAPAW